MTAIWSGVEKEEKSSSAERMAPALSNSNPWVLLYVAFFDFGAFFVVVGGGVVCFVSKEGNNVHLSFKKCISWSSPLRVLPIMPCLQKVLVLGHCQCSAKEVGIAAVECLLTLPAADGNHKQGVLLLLSACRKLGCVVLELLQKLDLSHS